MAPAPEPALDALPGATTSAILAGPRAAADPLLARWLAAQPGLHVTAATDRAAVPWAATGVSLLRLDPAAGLGATQAVRAFLRQDPDVVVLDAPADGETWPLLIQAALTGHQVLVLTEPATDASGAAAPLLAALGALGFSPAQVGGWLVLPLDEAGPRQVGWLGEGGAVVGWDRDAAGAWQRTDAALPAHLRGLERAAPAPPLVTPHPPVARTDARAQAAPLPRRRAFRRIAALVTVLLALAAGELAARLAVLGRVESLDRDAWHVFDPVLGWRGKAGFVGEGTVPVEPPRRFSVRLNANGWRQGEIAPAPAPDARRICLVGDSYVFGWGVEAEEALPPRLEALLGPGVEVLNLGVCAYGVDQMRLVVEREALPLRPDLIVVAVIADDFRRALRAVANVGHRKPRYVLDPRGTPRLTGVPVPPPAAPGSWQREDEPPEGGPFLLWRAGQLLERVRVGLGGGERARLRWRLGEALLRDAQRLAAAQGVPLVVALLPMQKHLEGREGDPVRPLLLELEPGLPVCDVYPAFEAAPDRASLFIPQDGHPSPAGQALQAEALAGFLRRRGLPAPR